MSQRNRLATPVQPLLLALVVAPLAGCGDYAPNDMKTDQITGNGGAPAQPAEGGGPSMPPPGPASAGAPAEPPGPAGAGAPAMPPPADAAGASGMGPPSSPAGGDTGMPEPMDAPAVTASCDMDATPCGGDVSGTWAVVDCSQTLTGIVDMLGFGLGCSEGSITSGSLGVTGTITFNPDGTYTDNTVTTGEEVVEMPPDCLNVSGTVTQCDRVGGPVQSSLGYETFECLPNDETMGCTCDATINQEGGVALVALDASTTGMYTSNETTLTLGMNKDYSYCVGDGTMVLTLAAPGKIGTVMGSIVLQKQ